ncbi:MAG TPA: DNA-processing protein DprA [Caldisericia bacterium]|nr:DNA-processing protein DprA [Caldisericia bacterium]HPB33168.1 DNA-processing protein DprA [Caldisericia bacterium]HQL66356.1 DNA-processing protein DprA [Caldisericia bacterium]HQN48414.1 DNA-processing protein DprA [Caldisericia bacterium]HQO99011.1 DNA-processing protein DprA [Caldisericia bacterium]
MDNLDELFEKYGEKEVTLKILKKNLTRRKKWEAINNGLIFSLFDNFNFSEEKKEIESFEKNGIKFLSFLNKNFPEELKSIPDPPIALFYKGEIDYYSPKISVVGTRRCSSYGKKVAEEIAELLSNSGVIVVSGLAYGIDSSAHIGALKGCGKTYAVLGGGLNKVYPKSNINLSKKIEERGAVISEYFPDDEPRDFQFPERNRIIAGLSKAVVLIEAPEKSGALITVDFAIDFGREVFCVPGPINSELSVGCHKIIRDGGTILTFYEDLLEFLNIKMTKKNLPELTKEEEELLEKIPYVVTYIDDFLNSSNNLPILISLESKGYIESFPGNYYTRKKWKG